MSYSLNIVEQLPVEDVLDWWDGKEGDELLKKLSVPWRTRTPIIELLRGLALMIWWRRIMMLSCWWRIMMMMGCWRRRMVLMAKKNADYKLLNMSMTCCWGTIVIIETGVDDRWLRVVKISWWWCHEGELRKKESGDFDLTEKVSVQWRTRTSIIDLHKESGGNKLMMKNDDYELLLDVLMASCWGAVVIIEIEVDNR